MIRLKAMIHFAFGMLLLTSCKGAGLGSHTAICSDPGWAVDANAEQVPVEEWMRLVFDESGDQSDCKGRPIEIAELPLRCAVAARPGAPRELPAQIDQAKIEALDGGFGLFWVPVEEFTNGDKTFFVAMVHTSKRALSVVGIGAVRLPPDQTDFSMQVIDGEELLFASGSGCSSDGGSTKCERLLRIMLLYDGRFVPLELRDRDNVCHGDTNIALLKSQEVRLRTGWIRRFELTSTYEVLGANLVINERLVVTDRQAGGESDNSRLFRSSDSKRELAFSGAYFIYEQESLWDGMRELRGDLRSGANANDYP